MAGLYGVILATPAAGCGETSDLGAVIASSAIGRILIAVYRSATSPTVRMEIASTCTFVNVIGQFGDGRSCDHDLHAGAVGRRPRSPKLHRFIAQRIGK
jgi:hypothetical protein